MIASPFFLPLLQPLVFIEHNIATVLLVLAVRSSLEQLEIVSWVQERQAMANLYQNAAGVWLIRFRFDGRQYYRSLDTVDEKEATGVKAQVEETLGLLKRGRLSLPPSAGFDEAALFIISGGKITERPAVAPAAKTLKEVD